MLCRRALGWIIGAVSLAASAWAQPAAERPVPRVAEGRLTVTGSAGQGVVPVEVSADWSWALPAVTRAVVMVHGRLRNADDYFRLAGQAREAAGEQADTTLLVAPQFLAQQDAQAHHLPPDVLRWDTNGWQQGSPALGPAALSSFEALDAVLARLGDTALFPSLRAIVVAGHSAGAQVVQRYAVVGRGDAALARRALYVRYVVANPSSYLWFGPDRPRLTDPASCPGYDRWKYGLRDAPPYVGETRGLERRYIGKDVVYLLGEADRNPEAASLDRSCAAMAQGENRFARGMQYVFALELRRPNLVRHRVVAVPGVGHDAAGMFGSVCGRAALFGTAGCPTFPDP